MKTINKIRINNFEGMIEMTEKGETLIKKIQRILDENEPLTDGAPMIYTPKQAGEKEFDLTKGTSEWEGWGTALKPAHEPICMARKPLSEKTVAENCLKWGTGGINIDESRVGTEDNQDIVTGKQIGRAHV